MKFFTNFLNSYNYGSFKDFVYSLFPSWKYHLQTFSLLLSGLTAIFNNIVGIGPGLAVAMFMVVLVEIYSGIKASKLQDIDFESFRFSRCVVKIVIWFSLFYFIHAFEREYEIKEHFMDVLAFIFFKSLFVGLMTLFCIEYLTSILENLSILDGKEKTYYINWLRKTYAAFLESIKNKFN